MKDTWEKLRALIQMKSQMLEVLLDDLDVLLRKCERLEAENEVLRHQQGWWQAQDKELGRQEAEERSEEIHIDSVVSVITEHTEE